MRRNALTLALVLVIIFSVLSILKDAGVKIVSPAVHDAVLGLSMALASLLWLFLDISFLRLDKLTRQLFEINEWVRYKAFEQLLQRGSDAIKTFTYILDEFPCLEEREIYGHCMAMEGLGRLKAKESVDTLIETLRRRAIPDISATAIWALQQIDDERAVKEIIPFLTDKGRIERQRWLVDWAQETLRAENLSLIISTLHFGTVSAIASAGLVQLGQSSLVSEFWKALRKRDKSAVERLKAMKEHRKEIAEALVRMLNTGTVSEAVNAAQLLGELWAFDVLPALRARARSLLTPEKVRKVCFEVVAKLEQLSRLPAPATAAKIDTSTLPRPVTLTEISTDTLPSPAEPPRDLEA